MYFKYDLFPWFPYFAFRKIVLNLSKFLVNYCYKKFYSKESIQLSKSFLTCSDSVNKDLIFISESWTLRRFLMLYCESYQCFWVLLRPSALYPATWDLKNLSRVVIRVHWSMCVKLHFSLFIHFLRLRLYFSVSCFFTKIKGGIIWDSFILINMGNYYAHLPSELFWFLV